MTSQPSPLLQISGLTKRFPGVLALDKVSLSLNRGEVLAVIGENGAGKSTLMKILAGVERADEGEIRLDGHPVSIRSVRDALGHKIALIHQELNLADNLDVGANIFLGREPRRLGIVDRKSIDTQSKTFLHQLGLECSPRTTVSSLSLGRQQLVEIAKALSTDARILIMDEPTSSLSGRETEHLYKVIRTLRDNGVSIIYISHRLGEVKEVADRVVVLRDGANAGELAREEISHDAMVRLMIGREISKERVRKTGVSEGEIALELKDVRTRAHPQATVNLSLRAGEIVGIAGLTGSGRTELLETIFGVTPSISGEIVVCGKTCPSRHPLEAIRMGMALVPENRKQYGLVLEMALRENLSLATLHRGQRLGWLNRGDEEAMSKKMVERLGIKCSSLRQSTGLLSGGNQQKVVLGKWLALEPKILLLDEPTRGIDVGSKGEIYALMERLAEQGVAILFASSELEEVLGLSDRALVLHDGSVMGELDRGELSEEAVMRLATGTDSTGERK